MQSFPRASCTPRTVSLPVKKKRSSYPVSNHLVYLGRLPYGVRVRVSFLRVFLTYLPGTSYTLSWNIRSVLC